MTHNSKIIIISITVLLKYHICKNDIHDYDDNRIIAHKLLYISIHNNYDYLLYNEVLLIK